MIIGLSGYARSGKDTVAAGMEGFERVAFADILREFLYRLNPVVGTSVTFVKPEKHARLRVQDVIDEYGWGGYKESPYGTEIRELLQRLGTECGRQLIDDEIWIKAALDGKEGNIVVTDVRFPNEAQAIKDRGGIIVRIIRDGVGPANAHASETALDGWKFDAVITNAGTIEQLHKDMEFILWLQ